MNIILLDQFLKNLLNVLPDAREHLRNKLEDKKNCINVLHIKRLLFKGSLMPKINILGIFPLNILFA